ncbi:CobW family GTP-binding protein [uncultured Sunxiuqinia sp.]|uniref:CobW family GTP-binding protein n=1 Tax=uncultured Sunxiuqinia sp. TaxID=1573825 RepID=UPI0026029258|nr:CobW family GTP-binding protein [uncultured Sunxiuqinia sp.]
MSIPLHLVTGFLGSGKTSFLNHYLENTDSKSNIAIIQNEFSSINIDGRKFQQDASYQVLEINNGSVFCVCLLGSFIKSLNEFVEKYQPDMLIMEASGLSDPTGVGQIFQSPQLKGKIYLEHVWCLVDALNFKRMPSLRLRMEHQLRCADTIIINKTDQVGNDTDEIATWIRHVNPFANQLKGEYGRVATSGFKKALNLFPDDQKGALGRPDVESVVIRGHRGIHLEQLSRFIDRIKKDCIRSKGFLKLKDGEAIFVQGVFSEFTFQEIPSFKGSGELVLIGTFKGTENLQIIYDEHC